MVLVKFLIVHIILISNSVRFGTSITVVGEESFSTSGTCSINSELNCKKLKKYFLYDVNPGEGFNLRRDVYIRVAPLIASLNRIDQQNQWILVLPPWGRIPHWKHYNTYFPWSSFFELSKIRDYIPALELSEFLDEYGHDSKISMVFQLQHFPFDPNDKTWSEKIELSATCEEGFSYKWDEETKDFGGLFWKERLRAANASCMSLRGQASTLSPFLLNSSYSSVMFDRAEVILWDDYSGSSWWEARRSLRFAQNLNKVALTYLEDMNRGSSETRANSTEFTYSAVHLRRRDFIFGRRRLSLPSVQGAAKQVFQIAKRLKLQAVFLASDAIDDEFEDFSLAFKILREDHDSEIFLFSLHESESMHQLDMSLTSTIRNLSQGQRAILDQIICSNASHFTGTPDSTFTLRIFEEREILGFDSESTFNYLCPDIAEEEDVFTEIIECKQPTKWKMKI